MTYIPFLISDFSTGFDRERQPWLLPNDAQHRLLDGYVYRGVWTKREGYRQFAYGQRGGSPYCESRMIHTVTVSANEVPDGIITAFTFTVAGTTKPLRRGGFRAKDKTALGVQTQVIQDNGTGGTLSGSNGTITTVLNYTTTLATPQGVTFTVAPAVGHLITLELDVHQGLPVMGVMNFFTQNNARQLITVDTKYVNRYNSVTNRLDDISPSYLLTGTSSNFFSYTNYPDPNNNQRLLFVNNTDSIQQYSGNTVTPYPVYTISVQVTLGAYGVGNGTAGPYTGTFPGVPGTYIITDTVGGNSVRDDQFGNLITNTGAGGSGTVNYLSGAVSVTFTNPVVALDPITITYKSLTTPITTCLHIFSFKDRLVVESVVENSGRIQGRRLLISGVGAMGDIFTTDAIGAGVIDIPDPSYIQSSDFNRDDLLIFTEESTWTVKYTGSDIVPFTLDKIDNSRGSQAPYGTVTYLNRTSAASTRGLILTDGYSVVRSDDKIPDYSYNTIDQANFNLCFAGSVDEDRDHYLIHPTDGQSKSDNILVTNYEEDNFSVYRIPLSCMGNFIGAFDITWDDLLIYNTWDEMALDYGNWNSFAYSQGAPFGIGGGHEGQITRLNDIESEDYPVKIRNAVIINGNTLRLTTDFHNFVLGDYIYLEGLLGMVQANDKQGFISATPSSNYTFDLEINTSTFSAYTGAGVAAKVINFLSTTKKFNPFAEQDQKVRCGWVYFYVSCSGTSLTENKLISNATKDTTCVLTVFSHGYSTGQQIYINGVSGMVELNDLNFFITVIDANTFSLNGIDSSGYTDFVMSNNGFTSTPTNAYLDVRIITNDNSETTLVNGYNQAPYRINMTNTSIDSGTKKWYKIWVNQVGKFVQFEFSNSQAGTKVEIHAIMPGFAGVGRLI